MIYNHTPIRQFSWQVKDLRKTRDFAKQSRHLTAIHFYNHIPFHSISIVSHLCKPPRIESFFIFKKKNQIQST